MSECVAITRYKSIKNVSLEIRQYHLADSLPPPLANQTFRKHCKKGSCDDDARYKMLGTSPKRAWHKSGFRFNKGFHLCAAFVQLHKLIQLASCALLNNAKTLASTKMFPNVKANSPCIFCILGESERGAILHP